MGALFSGGASAGKIGIGITDASLQSCARMAGFEKGGRPVWNWQIVEIGLGSGGAYLGLMLVADAHSHLPHHFVRLKIHKEAWQRLLTDWRSSPCH